MKPCLSLSKRPPGQLAISAWCTSQPGPGVVHMIPGCGSRNRFAVTVSAVVVGVLQVFWDDQPKQTTPPRTSHCLDRSGPSSTTPDQAIWGSRTGSMHLCHLAADRVHCYMAAGLPPLPPHRLSIRPTRRPPDPKHKINESSDGARHRAVMLVAVQCPSGKCCGSPPSAQGSAPGKISNRSSSVRYVYICTVTVCLSRTPNPTC